MAGKFGVSARAWFLCCGIAAAALLPAAARAQDLEPRAYSNSPVGMNFLIGGYGYSSGSVEFDPAVPLTNAQLHNNFLVAAYARSLDVWGKSGKFDVIVPYASLSGSALYVGQPKFREVSGFADPRFRFSVNFHGAPALTAREFAGYKQDLIIGASLQVSAPLGQYDSSKLVNIGTNRWAFKPELGFSKAWGAWIFEIDPGVVFYRANTDFLNGGTLQQDHLYTVQGHIVRGFSSGVWLALDGTYYTGGRTTVNGVEGDTLQTNTRAGLTLALPVDRYNSVKLYASTGTSSRGGDFTTFGIAWQHRWGGGY